MLIWEKIPRGDLETKKHIGHFLYRYNSWYTTAKRCPQILHTTSCPLLATSKIREKKNLKRKAKKEWPQNSNKGGPGGWNGSGDVEGGHAIRYRLLSKF